MKNMISQSDTEGRLRLLRYGLIVVVVVSFFVALLVPFAVASPWANEFNQLARAAGIDERPVAITDFLGTAVITAVVTAVVAVVIYIVYGMMLRRQQGAS
jgi:ABC-type Fe3+ transport system permease subunit